MLPIVYVKPTSNDAIMFDVTDIRSNFTAKQWHTYFSIDLNNRYILLLKPGDWN